MARDGAEQPHPTITPDQRDAIRDWLIWALHSCASMLGDLGIGAVGSPEDAPGMLEEVVDLAALLNDLGWASTDTRDAFAITLEGEQLERVLNHIQGFARHVMRKHLQGAQENSDVSFEFERRQVMDMVTAYESIRAQAETLPGSKDLEAPQ